MGNPVESWGCGTKRGVWGIRHGCGERRKEGDGLRSGKSPACPLVLSNFCSTNSQTTCLLLTDLTDLTDSLICPLVNLESKKDSVSQLEVSHSLRTSLSSFDSRLIGNIAHLARSQSEF